MSQNFYVGYERCCYFSETCQRLKDEEFDVFFNNGLAPVSVRARVYVRVCVCNTVTHFYCCNGSSVDDTNPNL